MSYVFPRIWVYLRPGISSSNLFSEENVAGALFLTSPTVSSSSENTTGAPPPRRDDDRRDDAFAPLPIRRLFFFVFVWVDDDRKFVERFFSNVFQSIFFLFIGACKCLPFFWWWCSIKYFVCVCVCMGCFSCKNLLKILQRAAAAERTNKYTRGTFFTRSSTTQNSRGFIRVDILEDVLQPLRRARVSLQLCFEFLYAFDDV